MSDAPQAAAPSTDTATAIKALKETKPPETDKFTYLTLIERYISPELLPTLNEILQDAQLTQDIGWDLVEMLVAVPGSEACLETVARLGNPREVIIKVLEVLEGLPDSYEDDIDEQEDSEEQAIGSVSTNAAATHQFITLLGMLAILHKRIRTKYPSRFLGTTLRTVLSAYRPSSPDMTASAINLVHSLAPSKRPPLPSRQSSVNVANPERDGDAERNAPDPEAEPTEDPDEGALQQRLLLAFVTCVLEGFVNADVGGMEWAPRLLEHYRPGRTVPGRKTVLEKFKEEPGKLARDTIVGQLVALAKDLGLSNCTPSFLQDICSGSARRDPLGDIDSISTAADVGLSTGGSICILAYWMFSSAVFGATNSALDSITVFPQHAGIMKTLLEDNPQDRILRAPGTADAALAVGWYLLNGGKTLGDAGVGGFMPYHHLVTLVAVYHPALAVRNAASSLAGLVLHADPEEDDRSFILEDLLENCIFPSLKSCAVTWLQEEIVAATENKTTSGAFSSSEPIERLQYTLFPNLEHLPEMDDAALLDYWAQNAPFVLQAAAFAFFLLRSSDRAGVVPSGMDAAVEERWARPLQAAAARLKKIDDGQGAMGEVLSTIDVLEFSLDRLQLS